MIHYTCDMCGREMHPEELRYVVNMDVTLAQDPLECATDDDEDADHLEELTEMIQQIEATGEEQLADEDLQKLRFDLCASCRKKFVDNPLGREALAKQLDFSKN